MKNGPSRLLMALHCFLKVLSQTKACFLCATACSCYNFKSCIRGQRAEALLSVSLSLPPPTHHIEMDTLDGIVNVLRYWVWEFSAYGELSVFALIAKPQTGAMRMNSSHYSTAVRRSLKAFPSILDEPQLVVMSEPGQTIVSWTSNCNLWNSLVSTTIYKIK